MIRGCRHCTFLPECGGLDGNLDFFGCHRATPEVCRANKWTCPECSPGEYLRRKMAVESRAKGTARPLGPSVRLPRYVPNLQHRYGWSGRLPSEVVAIPTHEVVGGRGRRFGPLFASAKELRRKFHLAPDTQVLLVSVSEDPFLERYWRWAKESRTAGRLAALGIAGITIPNFSFFSDAPRFHHLYNRGRLEACLNELAEAEVSVVPHIHALTLGDVAYWRAWLRDHAEIRHVCREFQTGNDEAAIDELALLQDQLNRDLHPIIVGGARFAERLRSHFRHYTLVDSTPFMKAVKGRVRIVERSGELRTEPYRTRSAHELGWLIRENVATYTRWYCDGPAPQLSLLDAYEQAILAREAAHVRQTSLRLDEQRIVRLPVLSETASVEPGPKGRGNLR